MRGYKNFQFLNTGVDLDEFSPFYLLKKSQNIIFSNTHDEFFGH